MMLFIITWVIVYDYELNIGWGKLVSLPSQSLPAPPPGQMAIRSKEVCNVFIFYKFSISVKCKYMF